MSVLRLQTKPVVSPNGAGHSEGWSTFSIVCHLG
ncbi:hypothetical protein HMPREF9706_01234 [Facklamia hominis CCUG 36813]|uniref:Uncharacterized protein n=1 Tax=Facklamia hominis CCUG 36813 TaxID=883111 RepID=K1MG73_9LACT|nr:hypothetical protein HMPREF9706_01234 [Facklamia hominis CCUG 36813]